MNQRLRYSLLLLSFLSLSYNWATAQKCYTSQRRAEIVKNYPGIADNIQKIQNFTEDWIAQNQSKSQRELVTLPIVVHVIYNSEEENISEEQILSQIPVLNEGFRKRNANFGETPNAFQSFAADVEVEFCMATLDPDGKSTNGITRTKTEQKEIGKTDNWYIDEKGGKTAWNGNEYINIWVCNLGGDLLGFASPPGTADPVESDGLVIDFKFYGTTGIAADNAPNHLGTTVTHEMGHYLNLEHLWGIDEGGCEEDDFVDDTPLQFTESEGCPTFPLVDDCTTDGDGIMFMNFMDYSDDECMTMFTEGQKLRMLAAINGPRASLLNSNACAVSTSTVDYDFFENRLDFFPNPTRGNLQVEINGEIEKKSIDFQILNVSGTLLHSFHYVGGSAIDLSFLPEGTYLLISKQYPTAAKKFIIIN